MENAKFRLGADSIEVSGPRDFVEEQLEKFKSLIETSYEKILTQQSVKPSGEIQNQSTRVLLMPSSSSKNHATEDTEYTEVNQGDVLDYSNVFTTTNDKIQLNCDIPGNSISSKMVNFALIYMWVKLRQGIDTVTYSELRDAGERYIQFDNSNFSKCMENNRKYFLITGDRNKSAKLIRAGIKEAEKLVLELNGQ